MSEPGSFYIRLLRDERDRFRKLVTHEPDPRMRGEYLRHIRRLERAADMLFLGNAIAVASVLARSLRK